MSTVTLKQVGLKPLPQTGGTNVVLLPAGTPVVVDPTWVQVSALGHTGWLHSADTGPAVIPPPAGVQPVGVPGVWGLKFEDEFNTGLLDPTKWTPNWLGGPGQVTPPVNSTYETACYDPAQVMVSNSMLILTATAKPQTINGKVYPFSSGMVQSSGKFNFTYGCFEARIWLPAGAGMWPAFWTDGQTWPQDGEIDVLEASGTDASCSYHYHYPGGGPGGNSTVVGSTAGWHTYAAVWEPWVITWYYDGKPVWQYTTGITSSPQYLILNLGLDSAQSAVPATMRVDYVRVWQH
jgi:beta-glucanase (GH16 family)